MDLMGLGRLLLRTTCQRQPWGGSSKACTFLCGATGQPPPTRYPVRVRPRSGGGSPEPRVFYALERPGGWPHPEDALASALDHRLGRDTQTEEPWPVPRGSEGGACWGVTWEWENGSGMEVKVRGLRKSRYCGSECGRSEASKARGRTVAHAHASGVALLGRNGQETTRKKRRRLYLSVSTRSSRGSQRPLPPRACAVPPAGCSPST